MEKEGAFLVKKQHPALKDKNKRGQQEGSQPELLD